MPEGTRSTRALRSILLAFCLAVAVAVVSVAIEPEGRALDRRATRPEAKSGTDAEPAGGPVGTPVPQRTSLKPYRGFGTWIDLYDDPNWKNPEREVRKMVTKGVHTLFLETANWRIDKAITRPNKVGRFIDAAHEAGIKVVAWYLPSFKDLKRDLRRSMAAINFASENGERFDSFALDIESTEVADIDRRNRRMFTLTRQIREKVGPMAIAAITPDPIGSLYWPDFPYAKVAAKYQVLMPMGYFTYRTAGAKKVAAHVGAGIRVLRRSTDAPIHYIGGLSMYADPYETRGYAQTAVRKNIMGGSLYDFLDTRVPHWEELRRLRQLAK